MNNLVKSLPIQCRPYEKCYAKGVKALSDQELLAILLRNGTKGNSSMDQALEVLKLMDKYSLKGLTGLNYLELSDFLAIKGIGKVKAITLASVGEVSRRIATQAALNRICFNKPETIAEYYMERLRGLDQEVVYCLMLDTKNKLIRDDIITIGTVNASLISPRDVFKKALEYRAVNIILVHNHPSGDPSPSKCDLDITLRIAEAGKLIDIRLLDHIIIGDRKFYSFNKMGEMY